MVVNAVSPDSVPNTNYACHQGIFFRCVVILFTVYVGRCMGKVWIPKNSANRYIEAGEFDADTTGHFFGSPPGKCTCVLKYKRITSS